MSPIKHIAVSAPLGIAVAVVTQSTLAGMLCFFSGFLIDIDHLVEYTMYYGFGDFRFKSIYAACAKMANREEEGGVKRIFFFLHTAEIAILLWVGYFFSKNIYFLAIALGYSGHLIMDGTANAISPWAYFITSRIKNGFRTASFVRTKSRSKT
ncbi:MAG: hypothetical protein JW869_01045 [Candidatus Omnitrophica bacterium]|nr:hypothetical protein [Candidatus Omnitrophota bacterium]